jgi:large subunit ribosomal protein L35
MPVRTSCNSIEKSNEKEFYKMGKVKTHKASAKRFSVTGTGKVKMNHCHRRHNTGNKSGNKLRHLRGSAYVHEAMADNIKALICK